MKNTTAFCGACLLVLASVANAPAVAGESDWKKIGSKDLKADPSETSMRVEVDEVKLTADGRRDDD